MELLAVEHEINAHHVILGLLLVVGEQPALEHEVARVEEGPADLPAAVAHHPALVVHAAASLTAVTALDSSVFLAVAAAAASFQEMPADLGSSPLLDALAAAASRLDADELSMLVGTPSIWGRSRGDRGGEGKQRGRERLQGWPGGRRAVAVFDID